MLKRIATTPKLTASVSNNPVDYTLAPAAIGAVLKEKAAGMALTPKIIAEKIGINKRSIYGIYKRKYLTIPEMNQWSEVLNENLFTLYHPNVKPLPDPRDAEIEKLKGYVKHLEDVENKNGILKNHNIKLEAKIELLMEQLDKKNGR